MAARVACRVAFGRIDPRRSNGQASRLWALGADPLAAPGRGPATEAAATLLAMAATQKTSVEIEADLLERTRRAAHERGVAVPQFLREALEHELAAAPSAREPSLTRDEGEQPPLTCIGAFGSGRGDLSKLASEDVFEARPSR